MLTNSNDTKSSFFFRLFWTGRGENSCLFIKTNKFAINSGQPDNRLRQLVALAQDRLQRWKKRRK